MANSKHRKEVVEMEDLFLEEIFGINLSHSIDQTNGRVRIRIPFSTNYMRISSLVRVVFIPLRPVLSNIN